MKYFYINLLGKAVKCKKPTHVTEFGFHCTNENGATVIVRPDNLYKRVKLKSNDKKSR